MDDGTQLVHLWEKATIPRRLRRSVSLAIGEWQAGVWDQQPHIFTSTRFEVTSF